MGQPSTTANVNVKLTFAMKLCLIKSKYNNLEGQVSLYNSENALTEKVIIV